jgi:predicted aminopeptidase
MRSAERVSYAPFIALVLATKLLSGCYFTQLAAGQLRLINGQVRLDAAIASERDPTRKRLLSMVPDIRRFARDVLQLRPGEGYTGYFATEAEGMTAVLAASEKTQLRAYTWWFPVAGSVPYKSYFDEADARVEAASLDAEGYDTWVGSTTAYSTLGFFRDPVTTIMMRHGTVAFVEVLLHEMVHARLYVPGQTDFNEQLASFVARIGTERYFASRSASDPAIMAGVRAHHARSDRADGLIALGIEELEALYSSGASDSVVLQVRARVFQSLHDGLVALYPDEDPAKFVMNNAHLLQFRRYRDDASDLQALFEQAGHRWTRFWPLAQRHGESLPRDTTP